MATISPTTVFPDPVGLLMSWLLTPMVVKLLWAVTAILSWYGRASILEASMMDCSVSGSVVVASCTLLAPIKVTVWCGKTGWVYRVLASSLTLVNIGVGIMAKICCPHDEPVSFLVCVNCCCRSFQYFRYPSCNLVSAASRLGSVMSLCSQRMVSWASLCQSKLLSQLGSVRTWRQIIDPPFRFRRWRRQMGCRGSRFRRSPNLLLLVGLWGFCCRFGS